MSISSKPNKIISVSVAWLKTFWKSTDSIDVSVSGPSPKIPLRISDFPTPTRVGYDIKDRQTPFVEMNFKKLKKYYYEYINSRAFLNYIPYSDFKLLKLKDKGFDSGFDVSNFTVLVHKDEFKLPISLSKHRESAIELFKALGKIRINPVTKEYQNDLSARIVDFSTIDGRIVIEPANYFEQVGSNLTIDWASGLVGGHYDTFRSIIEKPELGCLRPLPTSNLANTLGVAVFFKTSDEKILIPIRGNQQAIMSEGRGKFHCSASGVFEWPLSIKGKKTVDFEIFLYGMRLEIKRELNINSDQYELIPLAFARELARGGKPQLFFCALSNLDKDSILNEMKNAEENWEFLSEDQLPKNSPLLKWLTAPESVEQTLEEIESCYTYEGWTGLMLTQAFFEGKSII